MLGDVVSAARRHVVGGPGISGSSHADLTLLPVGEVQTRYQIMLTVRDEPGVLAAIAGLLAEHGVSVANMEQMQSADEQGSSASLVIGTHRAREADLAATVEAIRGLDVVAEVTSVLRLEGSA